MNAVEHIGKERRSQPRMVAKHNDDLGSSLPCELLPLKNVHVRATRDGARKQGVLVGRWLDQRVAILADKLLCSVKLDGQPSFLPGSAAACNSAGR